MNKNKFTNMHKYKKLLELENILSAFVLRCIKEKPKLGEFNKHSFGDFDYNYQIKQFIDKNIKLTDEISCEIINFVCDILNIEVFNLIAEIKISKNNQIDNFYKLIEYVKRLPSSSILTRPVDVLLYWVLSIMRNMTILYVIN